MMTVTPMGKELKLEANVMKKYNLDNQYNQYKIPKGKKVEAEGQKVHPR